MIFVKLSNYKYFLMFGTFSWVFNEKLIIIAYLIWKRWGAGGLQNFTFENICSRSSTFHYNIICTIMWCTLLKNHVEEESFANDWFVNSWDLFQNCSRTIHLWNVAICLKITLNMSHTDVWYVICWHVFEISSWT